jgi:hypothetical protein
MTRDRWLLAAALLLAGYTQLIAITDVPGLHFDEAWQGMFAHRIATEPGFHPFTAMNSYTSPIVHHLLALVFLAFGPRLAAMRGTYAVMNFATLGLIVALLARRESVRAAAWFAILWALLPLSVHIHRFYVEVTGYHGLALAVALWGLALWKKWPKLSFILLAGALIKGTYAHILFVAVFYSGIFVIARAYPAELKSGRARALIALVALAVSPLAIRMGLGLHKAAPFAMAAALALTAAWAAAGPRLGRLWTRVPRSAEVALPWLTVAAIPFLLAYVALLWNGPWAYAQATGRLEYWWIPINAAIFVLLAIHERTRPSLYWTAFVVSFLATSILILKQTPRYYTVPTILAMLWAASRLARARNHALASATLVVFAVWNAWLFKSSYIENFRKYGSTTEEFKLGPFHDNGRDFRPFQRVYAWLAERNCEHELNWWEDDRFGIPFQFLRLSAPPAAGKCPWSSDNLFFSHIPSPDPNVKLLAHFPEWGDLALWTRH